MELKASLKTTLGMNISYFRDGHRARMVTNTLGGGDVDQSGTPLLWLGFWIVEVDMLIIS